MDTKARVASLGNSKVVPRSSDMEFHSNNNGFTDFNNLVLTNEPYHDDSLVPQLPQQQQPPLSQQDDGKVRNTSYAPPFTSERALTFFFVVGTELQYYLQGYNLHQESLTSKYM